MNELHPILSEIDGYLKKTRMGESYFGRKACGNTELVPRLREGGGIHFKTERKVREFMSANPAKEAAA